MRSQYKQPVGIFNMSSVIVVTNAEMGWDCIVGVYKDEEAVLKDRLNQNMDEPFTSYEKFEEYYSDLAYFFFEKEVK